MRDHTVFHLPAPLEAAVKRVKHAARAAVEQTVESLGLSALSSNNMFQRDGLLAAQFELNRKSAIFILAFDEAFDSRVRRECAPRSSLDAEPSNWNQLSLVEHRELEIKVAAERFALEVAHSCEWELRELDGYVATILSHSARSLSDAAHGPTATTAEVPRNPVRPEVIGLALIRGADRVTEREEVRKVLVSELGRSLAATLGATYQAIVADLRNAGIRPAGMSVRTTEGHAAQPPSAPSQFDPSSSGVSTSGIESRSDTRSGFDRASPSGRSSGYGGALGQVEAGLMNLIRRLAVVDVATGGGATWSGAGEAIDTMTGRSMGPNVIRAHRDELRAASRGALDHMIIDVIGSLFDQIMSDPKVPPQMARQIARLQLPVLRAALGDPSFFSSRRHPVRRFINRIGSLGAAVDDFSDVNGQRFLAKVRELVQSIVEGDFEQIGLYESKLSALEHFASEQASAEIAAQGDAASLLAEREDQLRLRRLYAQQLQGMLKGISAPEFLREFVAQVWSQVLLKAAAADGADSARVKRLRQAGSELFMSVQHKATPAQRKTFLAELPKLMQALNEGLDLIAWPDAERRTFFGQLLPAHAEALKNTGTRTLDFNLMAKQVEGAMDRPLPQRIDLKTAPMGDLPTLSDAIVTSPFSAAEAQAIGLVRETAVDWNGKVDIDLDAEPELKAVDIDIAGLPAASGPIEPTQGKSLADHVQIGLAYQMHLEGAWQKVRLSHVSPARTFYVFSRGQKHKQTISLTHRMLVRLCETGRMRAFESAYLIERATARARRQLASMG